MGTHARSIGLGYLANDFCRNFRNEDEETVPHLLGICTALCQRIKKYLGYDYYINELSRIDIGSFSRFTKSSVTGAVL